MSHERRVLFDLEDSSESYLGREVQLDLKQSHHLKKVLRLKPGQEVVLACPSSGRQFEALITQIQEQVQIKILSLKNSANYSSPVSTLALAILKGDHNDLVCEKATELGVANIIFWKAARSISNLKSEADFRSKAARWQHIAESALKQSGQARMPKIWFSLDAEQMCGQIESICGAQDLRLCCALDQEAKPLEELASDKNKALHLVIGPEGDFTAEEASIIKTHRFQPVSLGPLRLRSETAAIAAVASANLLWGYKQI